MKIGKFTFDKGTHVMAIVNLTPDSFYAASRTANDELMSRVQKAVSDGAEVIDIVYQGAQTRYWVKAKDHRINIVTQHNRCYLDYKQPTWGDKVWVAWHRDDVTTLPEESPH